jgi:hypothetical protein
MPNQFPTLYGTELFSISKFEYGSVSTIFSHKLGARLQADQNMFKR